MSSAKKVTTSGAKAPGNPAVNFYLMAYNFFSLISWSYVFYLSVAFVLNPPSGKNLYDVIENPLKIAQTAAVLEILHAIVRFVRSSPFVTFVQVFSRFFILWGIVHISPQAQASFPFVIMALSWSLVEVVRSLFYIYTLSGMKIPYLLTWLRYSLFIILYPTGISGEIGCVLNSFDAVKNSPLNVSQPNAWNFTFNFTWVVYFILLTYIPGSPFMIKNMWVTRKKALAKVKEA